MKQINIDNRLLEGLKMQNISSLNTIQEEIFNQIVDNTDMVVQSETGSGKTLAYLLPIFERCKEVSKTNYVIILVPTHELVMQVNEQVKLLAKNSEIDIKSVPIIGDVNIERQIEALRIKPHIIVGTPARIHELIKKKKIVAHTVKMVVIDECDKMLDKKIRKLTDDVIKCTQKDRQLLFFSASMPNKIIEDAKSISKDPVIIKSKKEETVPEKIKHVYVITENRKKIETLRKLAASINPKRAIIFAKNGYDAKETLEKFHFHHMPVAGIYGELDKEKRKKVIIDFKSSKIKYLLATDIAARGLHFESVEVIFNLNIPQNPMDYLHRAGRTGRNNTEGLSILIITEEELPKIKEIQKEFKIEIEERKIFNGKIS